MRIAYFTGEYPRATDTFIQREIAGLRQLGATISTFAVRRPHPTQLTGPEQQQELAQTTYLLPTHPWKFVRAHLSLLRRSPQRYRQALHLAFTTPQPGFKGLLYQMFYFLEAGLLAHTLQHLNLQHLHNHFATSSGTVAMLAAALSGCSFSFTLHGPYIFFEPHGWHLTTKIHQAHFISCISYYCRSQAMVFAPTSDWERLHLIHCGIDPSHYQPVSHQGRGTRLLYIGRLAVVKGLPILLSSLAQLIPSHPDLSLTLVGDGPDRDTLEQMVRDLNLSSHVHFVGYQTQTQVRDRLQASDLFILSSFAEGIPVVLMEAMATGLPVIAPQIAGIAELVEDSISGYLVPPGDPDTLAQRIEPLITNPELRASLGQAGRHKVEQDFNIHTETQRLHKIFQQTIKPVRK